MSKFYYVLMDIGFDYNDEIYFSHGTGGHPKKVFLDKEAADSACLKLNLEEFKSVFLSGELGDYCYNIDEILNHSFSQEKIDEILNKYIKMHSEAWGDSLYKSMSYQKTMKDLTQEMSQDDWEELFDCFNLNFYEVVKVEKA